jgi:hypothetical protein
MSNPAADLLKLLVDELNAVGRERMQHLKPAYLKAESERLVKAHDEMETEKQLARYGVDSAAKS